jgi:hypothetical protein
MEEICQLVDVFKATEKTDEKKGWIITIDGWNQYIINQFWDGSSCFYIHRRKQNILNLFTTIITVAQALKTTPSRFWYATCAEYCLGNPLLGHLRPMALRILRICAAVVCGLWLIHILIILIPSTCSYKGLS